MSRTLTMIRTIPGMFSTEPRPVVATRRVAVTRAEMTALFAQELGYQPRQMR